VTTGAGRLALLATLAGAQQALDERELAHRLAQVGAASAELARDLATAAAEGLVARDGPRWRLAPRGIDHLLVLHAEIDRALAEAPRADTDVDCPSVPWLTQVQTEWIEAVSLNYAVELDALGSLLPAPLEPEPWKGTGWVQVLVSSLRDMRPQGLGSLFGVCFYQVSYRAAVRHQGADGAWRRGGYFVRSETNHDVMRHVGNALVEFKFHEFGAAEMVMVAEPGRLSVGIDAARPHGKLVGVFDTTPRTTPPAGSAWASLDELFVPLVECYDAFGVDDRGGWLYTLTIDRGPWNARFARPLDLYCEYFETGPLASAARLDSVLHIPRCPYRWRPLRRQPLAALNRRGRPSPGRDPTP